LSYWGSKSGSRQIFAECQIPHPDGSYTVSNTKELLAELANLWERQPHLNKIVIKLNEGFSGEGNAVLNLKPIKQFAPAKSDREATLKALEEELKNLSFQGSEETWANFSRRIPELGAIVEAFIEGEIKRSPSVQGYIQPSGEVSILSTHDQILGGADNQIYLGCYFPAESAYRLKLQEFGLKVGQALAAKGAIERYGVDFMAVQHPETKEWELEAIEINLRKGGTTHPFMTLKLLTNGKYDNATGLFLSQDKQPKYYISSDNLQKESYRGLLPNDLMDIVAQERLHFDNSTRTGSVFHLMGALSEFGKLGLTSIGDSREEAQAIYSHVEEVLDREAKLIRAENFAEISARLPINWL
jgi:PGM1 C-terminal domain